MIKRDPANNYYYKLVDFGNAQPMLRSNSFDEIQMLGFTWEMILEKSVFQREDLKVKLRELCDRMTLRKIASMTMVKGTLALICPTPDRNVVPETESRVVLSGNGSEEEF